MSEEQTPQEKPLTKNPGYEIDQNFYSVENKRIKYTDNSFMTEFTDLHYGGSKDSNSKKPRNDFLNTTEFTD